MVWANSGQGTKVSTAVFPNHYEVYWTVRAVAQDLLHICYWIEPSVYRSCELDRLASDIAAASELIEQMVGYVITDEILYEEFGHIYKVIQVDVTSSEYGHDFNVIWQTAIHGKKSFQLRADTVNLVQGFEGADRVAVVFRESWTAVAEVYHDLTGIYPPQESDDFFSPPKGDVGGNGA